MSIPSPESNFAPPLSDSPDISQDDKTMAMLAYLLGIFTGFVGPLVHVADQEGPVKFRRLSRASGASAACRCHYWVCHIQFTRRCTGRLPDYACVRPIRDCLQHPRRTRRQSGRVVRYSRHRQDRTAADRHLSVFAIRTRPQDMRPVAFFVVWGILAATEYSTEEQPQCRN